MHTEYIQELRAKLDRRAKRLKATGLVSFQAALRRFLVFLTTQPVFLGILEDLEHRYASLEAEADGVVHLHRKDFEDELKQLAVSYSVLTKCADHPSPLTSAKIGGMYEKTMNIEEGLVSFKLHFVDTLYEYLDEQLDEQRAFLALLRRYKHKCEWFQSERLFSLWENDPRNGEKLLQRHLYEYLHDQGLDFLLEPSSPSGEVDLIADQRSDDPLIADTKIFNPEKGRGRDYIAKGFNQVYIYTCVYNKPFGYLIIYRTSAKELRFALATETQSTPFVVLNNKTIFLVVLDIYPHAAPASTRGVIEPIEVTEQHLIRTVEEGKRDSDG
jgi:hypothetical protein